MIKKLLLLLFLLTSNFLSAQMTIEDSIQKSKLFQQQGNTFRDQANYLKAIKELKKALYFNPKSKIYKKIDLYYLIGKNYQESYQLDSAKIYYQYGHNLVHDSMSNRAKYVKYFHLFNFSHLRNKIDSTMYYGLKAYDFAERTNDKKILGEISIFIGTFFLFQKNYKKSEEYLKKGYNLSKQKKNQDLIYEAEIYLGHLAMKLSNYDEAEERLLKALQYFKKVKSVKGVFLANGYLTQVYDLKNNKSKVLELGNELVKDLEKFELSGDLDKAKKNIIKQNENLNNNNISDSLKIIRVEEYLEELIAILPKESLLSSRIANINSILDNQKMYDSLHKRNSSKLKKEIAQIISIQDSIYQENLKKKYDEFEVIYQTERKEKENEVLKRNRDWFIFGIILSILALIGFITYAMNRRRKIFLQNQIKISDARDKESHGIGIELHGKTTRKLDSIAKKLTAKNEQPTANEVISIKDYIRNLSHGLIQTKFLDDEFDEQLISIASDFDKPNFKINLNELKEIPWKSINQTVKRTLLTVIEEIIINAEKHANASKLDIHFEKKKKFLYISAIDNGIGFDMNTKPQGKGIQLIKEEVDQINGKASINSKPNKQTEIKLEITLV